MAARVLVVDDERSAREYLTLLLTGEGHRAVSAADGVEALLALEAEPFDLVIADLRMPRLDGLELVQRVKQRWSVLPVIVITAESDVSAVVEAVQLGAINYLVKPASPTVVIDAVRKALAIRTPAPAADGQIPEIVGHSPRIIEVRQLVALAARSDFHVLITGETGTGKELVARAIHHYSGLASEPFVSHNCALAPRDLFESEFFGHRRGAFTGADRDHVGLLSQADGGVLFLDEVEALAPELQAKLLRVLDDGEVRPVGSEDVQRVSVRFLAATNRDPQQMIAEGTLREDLYYRLRGFEIHLPLLRERPEDVPLLARHFLGGDGAGFEPDAMAALARAPWPGNVRELRNAVLAAKAAAQGGPIGRRQLGEAALSSPTTTAPQPEGTTTLREIERQAVVAALRQAGNNRTHAARMLGIDRSTLRRKIQEFGIDPERH